MKLGLLLFMAGTHINGFYMKHVKEKKKEMNPRTEQLNFEYENSKNSSFFMGKHKIYLVLFFSLEQ